MAPLFLSLTLRPALMGKLNFAAWTLPIPAYLKNAEIEKRDVSRVPNMDYGVSRKKKFLCGVVLQVREMNCYVPVTSFKQQKPDNFLVQADNGQIVASV